MAKFSYDSATAISQGCRDRQEDAIAADFQAGFPFGFAVLADGMGGHAAGDVASKVIVTEVFAELKLHAADIAADQGQIGTVLQRAAAGANACLADYTATRPKVTGMGATLLAPVILEDRLYWISVGDSPLFLFRDGQLHRLNEEHSVAAQLDQMVARGKISEMQAQSHPDRHCVTSVLTGRSLGQVDCPGHPVTLRAGDIVLAASDGVQSLATADLAEVLRAGHALPSAVLAQRVLDRVLQQNAPEQDNLSFCVVRIVPSAIVAQSCAAPSPQVAGHGGQRPRMRRLTFAATAHRREGQLVFETLTRSAP